MKLGNEAVVLQSKGKKKLIKKWFIEKIACHTTQNPLALLRRQQQHNTMCDVDILPVFERSI